MGAKSQMVPPTARKGAKGRSAGGGGVARGLWFRVAELRAEGKSATDIAAEMGRHVAPVARTLREPDVIAAVERIQADRRGALEQDIRAAAAEAWQTLRLGLAATKEEVQIRAACEILDRAGIVARRGVEVSGPGGAPVQVAVDVHQLATLTPEQLRALAGVQHAADLDVGTDADIPAEDPSP